MKTRRLLVGVALLAAVGLAKAAIGPELLAHIPVELREAAAKWIEFPAQDEPRWLKAEPAQLRRQILFSLAGKPEAAAFVLERLPTEPTTTKTLILSRISSDSFWLDQSGVDQVLQRLVKDDSELSVVRGAAAVLVKLQMKRVRAGLAARQPAGDPAFAAALAALDEHWVFRLRGNMLPGFLARPPAVFEALPREANLRVVAFGDFGTGSAAQREVAASIQRLHQEKPFTLGLTLGDNFYDSGMPSLTDPRWRDWWEALYGPLGIKFYATLGNHDWFHQDSPAAEILYSEKSPSWRMPATYYTYTAGEAQFFALDTTEISRTQLDWLAAAIAASRSRWKIVYGHQPVFGPPGESPSYNGEELRAKLWPVIRGKVDVYLCGHHHSMGDMPVQEGVHFVLAGGGGAPLFEVKGKTDAKFAAMSYGFVTLDVTATELTVQFYDGGGHVLYEDAVQKETSSP